METDGKYHMPVEIMTYACGSVQPLGKGTGAIGFDRHSTFWSRRYL